MRNHIESYKESGHKLNSEWMQRVSNANFRENQNSISQMLQGPNLVPSTFNAFHPPPLLPMTNYSQGG